MYVRILLLCALLLCVVPSSAFAIGFEVAVGKWTQNPSGDISYDSGILTGDVIDLDSTLNFGEESRTYFRAKIDLPMAFPNIYFMSTPMRFTGSNVVSKSINFGGQTFSAAGQIDSSLSMNQYDFALYYGIPFLKTATAGLINLDIGLNIRNMNFEAELNQPTLNLSESKSLTVPVPMIYVGAQIKPVDYVAAELEARLISFDGNGYYDYIARLKVLPLKKPFFFSVGTRMQNVKLETEGIDADIKFSGSFFEVGMEF